MVFPEYILMAVSYRFFGNLEVAIKDRERYFSNRCKTFARGVVGNHFQPKLGSEP